MLTCCANSFGLGRQICVGDLAGEHGGLSLLGGRGDHCRRRGVRRGITGANYCRSVDALLQSFEDVLGHLALLALVGLLRGCDDSHPAATTVIVVVLQTAAAVLLLKLILFRVAENFVELLLVLSCHWIGQVMTHISIPANLPTMLSRPRLSLCRARRHTTIPSSHYHIVAILRMCDYWLLLLLGFFQLVGSGSSWLLL